MKNNIELTNFYEQKTIFVNQYGLFRIYFFSKKNKYLIQGKYFLQ